MKQKEPMIRWLKAIAGQIPVDSRWQAEAGKLVKASGASLGTVGGLTRLGWLLARWGGWALIAGIGLYGYVQLAVRPDVVVPEFGENKGGVASEAAVEAVATPAVKGVKGGTIEPTETLTPSLPIEEGKGKEKPGKRWGTEKNEVEEGYQ